jgi:hypothetical protein
MTPDGLFDVFLNETHVFVDWVTVMPVQPMGPHIPFQWAGIAPMVSISFVDHCVMVEWEDVTVQILEDVVIMIIDFIIITWYFFFEMITIIIYDLTIIFYLTVIELLLVLIYYTFEIKIYETQVVMVYEMIEIIFLFVSILIWEITFIFHFEFWFIQFIFIVDLVAFIFIHQLRIMFIPVIIPVFISTVYYVPVVLKEYVHIYVPYAAEQLFIDVVGEVLQQPTHTMSYRVTDQLGNPVIDANVDVDYNGTIYPATHVGGGQYNVDLPASDEEETITVTASKNWYPTAILTYDLEVTWVIDTVNVTTTVTAPSPLPIISVIASLFAVSLAAMVINKKKKK